MPHNVPYYSFDELDEFDDWEFHGEGDCFFGVELEMDEGGCSSSNGSEIIDTVNVSGTDHAIFKDDGSLGDGLEIISHPCTLQYHKSHFGWDSLLQRAKRLGYGTTWEVNNEDSDDYGCERETCGLHIHINRNAFGVYDGQLQNIAKMMLIIERFRSEVFSFTRRNEERLNYYARFYGTTNYSDLLRYATSGRGKYYVVNVLHYSTVEIRAFNSTLDYNTLIGTLEFCQLLVNVATTYSVEDIGNMTWDGLMQIGKNLGFNDMLNVARRYVGYVEVA